MAHGCPYLLRGAEESKESRATSRHPGWGCSQFLEFFEGKIELRVLGEDYPFEMVFRQGFPLLPSTCLETTNVAGYLLFCQFPVTVAVEGAIGVGGGNVDIVGHHEQVLLGRFRKGIEFGAAAEAERLSAIQKERHVAAEAGGEFLRLTGTEWFAGQHGKGEQNGGRVGGAAAKTAAHRNAFDELAVKVAFGSGSGEHSAGGAEDEIVGDVKIGFKRRLRGPTGRKVQFERVGERDGLEDGAEFVKTIGSAVQDREEPIDFGVAGDADVTGLSHS